MSATWWPVSVEFFTPAAPHASDDASAAVRAGLAVTHVDPFTVRLVESTTRDRRAVGATFHVQAVSLAEAAERAVDLVRRALTDAGIPIEELHEVTVENRPRTQEPTQPGSK